MTTEATTDAITTDHELGRRLQMDRALLWIAGVHGDGYARIRCGADDDPYLHYTAIRATPLQRSRCGTWVTARHDVGSAILADDTVPAEQVDGTAFEAICHQHATAVDTTFDVVADFARPVVAAAFATVNGVPATAADRFARICEALEPAPNTELCPQRLDVATGIAAALAELPELVADPPFPPQHLAGAAVAAIGTAVHTLLPQWPPADAAAATAAALHHEPPIQVRTRVAASSMQLAGVDVAAGERLAVLVGGAHRDPDRPADAADLTFAGTPAAGALIGTLTRIAVAALAERAPRLTPHGDPVRLRRSPVVRGFAALPVVAL